MTSESTLGTALITGASSGIGEIYADRLAHRGYDLVLTGRNKDKLAELARILSSATGRKVDAIAADLGKPADLAQVEARLRDDAAITLLVNNAGLLANGPLAEADVDALTQVLDVNVTALTRLSTVAARAFAGRKQGAIVNIASAMAYIDTPNTAVYAATKSYVLHFTMALDLELQTHGVQVQAVLPGYTRTPMIGQGANLPPEIVMAAEDLVDAALVGFDQGEVVTIPSLENTADYEAWTAARATIRPQLSLNRPAPRYGVARAQAAE